MKSLFPFLALSSSLVTSQAATTVISDLSDLGPADETLTTLQAYSTFNSRTVNSVTTVDVKDATFALLVDFNSIPGSSTSNEILWEAGGGTVGFSLAYVPNTQTLTLRHASNGGNTLVTVSEILTGPQLADTDLELIWTFSTDGGPSGQPQIEFYIDGISAGTGSNSTQLPDWSGGDGATFGVAPGGVAGTGSNGNLPNSVAFTDGTINTTSGLRFWADTRAVVIPEPSGALLSFTGLAFLAIRRRD